MSTNLCARTVTRAAGRAPIYALGPLLLLATTGWWRRGSPAPAPLLLGLANTGPGT